MKIKYQNTSAGNNPWNIFKKKGVNCKNRMIENYTIAHGNTICACSLKSLFWVLNLKQCMGNLCRNTLQLKKHRILDLIALITKNKHIRQLFVKIESNSVERKIQ